MCGMSWIGLIWLDLSWRSSNFPVSHALTESPNRLRSMSFKPI